MSLSDIMSAAGLSAYAEAALVIFLFVFAAIVAATFSRRQRERLEGARMMPLRDDSPIVHSPRLEEGPTSTDRERRP